MSQIHKFWDRLAKFLSSRGFFILIVISFVVQASWIAFSGLYPMAFDEDTHLGIIRFFASHPNPFFTHQPSSLNVFGAVVHDPSYLYHYLMSFPWQLITHLTSNFTAQVILLRLVNVGLFATGIAVFRLLLLKATGNKVLVNLALLLLVLTPITSQLAAQINYDNLLLPLIALCLLLSVDVANKLRRGGIDLSQIGWLVCLLLITPLVKYTFLTILIPISLFLLWQLIKLYRLRKTDFWQLILKDYKQLSRLKLVVLSLAVVLSFGLFFERYGLNLIRYHTPTPSCVQVVGVGSCQSYSIYQRSIDYAQNKPDVFDKNPVFFTYRWAKHMLYNLMMALNGPASGYSVGQPLPLPYGAAILFGVVGLVLSAVFWRRLFNNSALKLFVFVIFFYSAALWITNYSEYFNTGRRVAIQGRYLVPLLPLFNVIFLLAFVKLLSHWPKLKISLATALVLCFLAGGGAATFILHSDATWYWPGAAASRANQDARQVIRHFVPGWGADYKPYWQSSFQF